MYKITSLRRFIYPEKVNNGYVKGIGVMNFLAYTKRLSEIISYYDAITKPQLFNTTNPFKQPINITVIWVDERDNDDNDFN